MARNRLFNIHFAPAATTGAAAVAPPATAPAAVGVITAPQAAITFAGAPAAVMAAWKVLGVVIPAVAGSKLFPVALSLIVGMCIYGLSEKPATWRERVLGATLAFVNSFAIAATTLGIATTL